MSVAEHNPTPRRGFFREMFARVVRPLADQIEKRIELPVVRTHLRPPGAVHEELFLDTCYRCGACIDVCPVKAIFPLNERGPAAGSPVIDPDLAACALCEGLACTKTCPSGGLIPLEDPLSVQMGVAMVYRTLCVRSRGEDCTKCVEACPISRQAIRITGGGPPEVLSPGCVGCGMCQLHCPTTPKAIVVKPG